MDEKIDFVITWVDGGDKDWLAEKMKYLSKDVDTNDVLNAANRYRDMETLKYWFRCVEKYAPWVNKIFFVTWGHIPKWLNINNPKLKIVNHKDYIPQEYLPTFNSNVIELNLHRINELSECFVNFNDDMFITDYVNKDFFFRKGLPRGTANLYPILPRANYDHTTLNNVIIINRHFNKEKVMKKFFLKFFNLKYGLYLLRFPTLNSYRGRWCGFYESHSAISHLKSTMKNVWKEESDALDSACKNRFRANSDISHWLFEKWNFMTGKFYPISKYSKRHIDLSDNNEDVVKAIINRKYKILCINDASVDYDFEKAKKEIIKAFEEILPEKSSFEL